VFAQKEKLGMVRLAKRGLVITMSLALAGLATPSAMLAQEASCPAGTPEENQALVEQYIAAVEAGDAEQVDALLHDDFSHNLSRAGIEVTNDPGNADEVATLANVADAGHTIDDIFAAGDRVAVRFSYSVPVEAIAGSNATEPVATSAIAILRIECGTIREAWFESDTVSVLLGNGYTIEAPAS